MTFAPAWEPEVREAYVAFVDILGFSRLIEDDFEGSVQLYQQFLAGAQSFKELSSEVSVRVLSDALVAECNELLPLVQVLQALGMITQAVDCMVRGGIAFGRHAVQQRGDDTLVVSQALSRAVAMEGSVRHPCIALDDSVVTEDWYWLNDADTFERHLLYFEGVRLVNPFNLFWGASAGARAEERLRRYPKYAAKYEWFLRLFEAVRTRDLPRLLPPQFHSYLERVPIEPDDSDA